MKRKINVSLVFEADAENEEQYMKFLHYSLSELGGVFCCKATKIFVGEVEKLDTK